MQVISRKEARAAGLKRYFSGKPCPHGHTTERMVSSCACCECLKASSLALYRSNAKRYYANSKPRRDAKREEITAYKVAYRKAHPDQHRETKRRFRERNKDKIRAEYAAWRDKNRDKLAARMKLYVKANPIKYRAYAARRKALTKTGYTDADVTEIFKAQSGKCAYCRVKLGEYHIDHIIALSTGGSNERSNIQLCCEPCNLSKSAKHPIDYARSLGMLL